MSSHARRELGQGSGKAEQDRPFITGLAGVRVPSSVLPGTSVPVFFCPRPSDPAAGPRVRSAPVCLRCGLRMALDAHLPLEPRAYAPPGALPKTRLTGLSAPAARGVTVRPRDASLYALVPAGSAPMAAAAVRERPHRTAIPGDRRIAEPSVRLWAASSPSPGQPRPIPTSAVAG